MIGEQVASSNLGDVKVGSAAYEAGFRSGDRIVSINGEEVQTWKDVKDKVLASAEVPLSFTIERHLETGQTESLTLESTPKRMANENVFSTEDFVGDIEGFSNSSRASTVGIIDPTSVAHIAGLRTGDTIMKLNGIEVDRWRQLIETIPQQVSGSQLNLLVMRQTAEKKQPEELPITIDLSDLNRQGSGLEILKSLGIEYPDLYLSEVIKESPAEKAGLRAGDKILAINSEPINSWDQVLSTVSSYQKESGPIQVKAQRGSAELNFEILPKMTTQMNEQGAEIQRFTVGIVPAMLMSIPDNFELRTLHPGKALVRGSQLTWHWTKFTLLSFLRLIQNRVSAKNISGVISIGQVASRSFQVGMSAFLTIMAIISINLFVLNLLPIPILDGGHLVFFTIEALRGAPLSMKKLEMAQQVGLVLLLGLMAFALFNDVTRLLNFSW
jgi:regulator of sigma E protease